MNLKKIIKFLTSSAVIQILNFGLSFVAIKFLDLTNLGKYTIAKSISGTFQFANLGFRYGLDRKLPETENESLNQLRLSICSYINFLISGVIMAIIIVRYGYDYFYLIYALGGLFIAAFTLIKIFFRGTNNVNIFIKSTFYGGIIPILASIIGLVLFGLKGLAIMFLVGAFSIYYYYSKKVKILSLKIVLKNRKYAYLFFKTGIIIYLTNFFVFMVNNFDRFFIEEYSGIENVGEYGIIILVFTVSLTIPSSILEMVFPSYIKDKKDKKSIYKHAVKHLKVNFFLVFLFILISFFLIPYIIPIFFNKYSYLIEAMKIILFALIPYVFIGPLYAILFAFDKHKQILAINIIVTIIYFLSLYLVLKNGFNIINLAYLKIAYTSLNLILMFIFFMINKKAIFSKK